MWMWQSKEDEDKDTHRYTDTTINLNILLRSCELQISQSSHSFYALEQRMSWTRRVPCRKVIASAPEHQLRVKLLDLKPEFISNFLCIILFIAFTAFHAFIVCHLRAIKTHNFIRKINARHRGHWGNRGKTENVGKSDSGNFLDHGSIWIHFYSAATNRT